LGRRILGANNRRGTFDNLGDTEEGLGEILSAWFERVELETVATMAIFAATNPRTWPQAWLALPDKGWRARQVSDALVRPGG
jgi:hypothetical protein